MSKTHPLVGKTFRFTLADDNALFVVTDVTRGIATAVVKDEPFEYQPGKFMSSDHAGLERVFKVSDVEAYIQMDEFWKTQAQNSESFKKNLPVGTIVHYSHGFGQYVRMERVAGRDKPFKAVALVGAWRDYDLPRRYPNGAVHTSYQVDLVLNGEGMDPHESTIYESPRYSRRAGELDPATMTPISLTLPSMTKDEERVALLFQARDKVRSLIDAPGPKDEEGIRQLLRQIEDIVVVALG